MDQFLDMTLIWEPSNDDFSLLSWATEVSSHVTTTSSHGGAGICHENMPRFEVWWNFDHFSVGLDSKFWTFFEFRACFEFWAFFNFEHDENENMMRTRASGTFSSSLTPRKHTLKVYLGPEVTQREDTSKSNMTRRDGLSINFKFPMMLWCLSLM